MNEIVHQNLEEYRGVKVKLNDSKFAKNFKIDLKTDISLQKSELYYKDLSQDNESSSNSAQFKSLSLLELFCHPTLVLGEAWLQTFFNSNESQSPKADDTELTELHFRH